MEHEKFDFQKIKDLIYFVMNISLYVRVASEILVYSERVTNEMVLLYCYAIGKILNLLVP